MTHIPDWAARCAKYIATHERQSSTQRLADIIAHYAEPVEKLLQDAKRPHYHCDDSWYCCRACRNGDHVLIEGEHLGNGEDGPGGDGKCTCGADEWNRRVEEALK